MLAKRIIAALDIDKGRVVKGVKFKGIKDAGSPLKLAKEYENQGIDELVFLDITASHEDRSILLELVEKTAEKLYIPFTVGGGIRSLEDMRKITRKGADKVFINTAAVKDPDLIEKGAWEIGSANLVVAIDAKRKGDDWKVFTRGGRNEHDLSALKWARRAEKLGAGEILLTSMDADGTKEGFDLPLLEAVSEEVDIPVIASGGAGGPGHFYQAFESGVNAALAASIFHYGEYTVEEVKEFLLKRGINVRPKPRRND